MPTRPTHRFIATYKGVLAGVVVMATPNSFSNLLGEDKKHLEKLISRGACISWSPKNLASALIMFSIRYMVKNTNFRFFTAYSDVEARELGTIYQACNFTYLGQNAGARCEYFDPLQVSKGWFSDRQFRKPSQVRRYAKELGIPWAQAWGLRDKVVWENIPIRTRDHLKEKAKLHHGRCSKRSLLPKHKYVYVLGKTQKETLFLRKLFRETNQALLNLSYPKIRGPQNDMADNNFIKKEINLTQDSQNCRPQYRTSNRFLTVKEVAHMLRVSEWTIYNLIKTDQTFPYLNIGLKKKLVIDGTRLTGWTETRSRFLYRQGNNIPSSEDLIRMRGV